MSETRKAVYFVALCATALACAYIMRPVVPEVKYVTPKRALNYQLHSMNGLMVRFETTTGRAWIPAGGRWLEVPSGTNVGVAPSVAPLGSE